MEGGFDMDVVKHYTYFEGKGTWKIETITVESKRWVEWVAVFSPAICSFCFLRHGRIFDITDPTEIFPLVHPNCNCSVVPLVAFVAGTATRDGQAGVDLYLFLNHRLPEGYLTKEEAKERGWKPLQGNLSEIAPNAVIGGSVYKNWDKRLPSLPGRIWYEADIEYEGGFRNGKRIIYSSDGLMFITFDHYFTFSEIIFLGEDK